MMIKERNEILKRINTSVISPEALSRYVVSAVYTYMFPDKRLPETVKVSLDESILENVKKGINDLAVSEMRELTEDMISGESVYKSPEKSNSYISQLAANLLDIQQGETVLDFGCGEGAFLAYVMKLCKDQGMDISLSGVEINELNSKIAEMALEILGGELKVTTGDFLERTTKLPDYDKAYVYPPFALKKTSGIKYVSNLFEDRLPAKLSPEWYFVDKLIEQMEEGKKAVAVLPEKVMYFSWDTPYRKFLLEKGLVEAVIELPKNTLNGTLVKPILLVLSTNNTNVRFVDASDYIVNTRSKTTVPQTDRIVKEYLGTETSVNSKFIHRLDVVVKHDSVLLPSSIVVEKKNIENAAELKELAEIDTGVQYTLARFKQDDRLRDYKTNYRLLTSADINEDGTINFDTLKNYAENVEDFAGKYSVKKGDLVITSKSTKVKVAIIEEEPEGAVIVTGGMHIIHPKENLDGRYLKVYLDSETGRSELSRIQKGSTILTISESDLETLQVPRLTMDEQKSIGNKMAEINKEITELQRQLDKKREELRQLGKQL